ncbi:MAG: carbonic anhydrase [Chloroflexota bacterium]
MVGLQPVDEPEDIFAHYRQTPIGILLEYQNFGREFQKYIQPQLLVGTCMDYRIQLRIPPRFAYILRSGGANMRSNDFYISYAISMGGISSIALIGHTQCAMADAASKRADFVKGMMVNAGWDERSAEVYFDQNAQLHQVGVEIEFIINEARRLQRLFPGVCVAPLLYKVEDLRLYLIIDNEIQM